MENILLSTKQQINQMIQFCNVSRIGIQHIHQSKKKNKYFIILQYKNYKFVIIHQLRLFMTYQVLFFQLIDQKYL